jgi:hypothetical protein
MDVSMSELNLMVDFLTYLITSCHYLGLYITETNHLLHPKGAIIMQNVP